MKVFVLDAQKKPLAPCCPARARQLLKKGKAVVFRRFPFTIILKRLVEVENIDQKPLRLKIDPGSKTTGIAIINDKSGEIEFAAELKHRGEKIKDALDSRRAVRRNRRNRKTRYRKPRFKNRRKPEGWLAPSLRSRVLNIETWTRRLKKLCPIKAISVEMVRFDTQKMQNPEISGKEYQQGELEGYEIREYLLEKWGRKCAYCHRPGGKGLPLEVEHIVPKSRGGTDRVSNLTLSCKACNRKKGDKTASEYGFPEIQKQALSSLPMKDAAVVNATRWEIYRRLEAMGLPVEAGTGGLTKFNRIKQKLPKSHWLDAACVGISTPPLVTSGLLALRPLIITATGHGHRQMCGMNRYGFPIRHRRRQKQFFGFQTGDIVKAVVKKGKKAGAGAGAGVYVGRVLVRATGSFDICTSTKAGRVQGVNWKSCQILHHTDGYNYNYKEGIVSSAHLTVAASTTQNL